MAWDQQTIAELIDIARQGDASPLLKTIEPLIRSIVRKRIAPQDVDDVTQEVLHTVYAKLDDLNDVKSFRGWVMTIARREAVEYYRTIKQHSTLEVDEYSEACEACEDTPVTLFDRNEEIQIVKDAVAELPEEDQYILMDYYGGSKVREIAERLGQPNGTIKRKLYEIRKKIHDILTA